MLFNYFSIHKSEDLFIVYERKNVKTVDQKPVSNMSVYNVNRYYEPISDEGVLLIDFANKFIGGGVLDECGCAQEEIMFAQCPELILSCLFTEPLDDNESVAVHGFRQYSASIGYGFTFKYSPVALPEHQSFNVFQGKMIYNTHMAAVDAVDYRSYEDSNDQYSEKSILREKLKFAAGCTTGPTGINISKVATGLWGSGAFLGDSKVKFSIMKDICFQLQKEMYYHIKK